MSYLSLSPQKNVSAVRHSYQTTAVSSPQRLPGFSQTHEIPLNPLSTYTISYVPGMSEHSIDTGKTFEDAKMKIITLTCELERVNTHNYSLVRENEVLRVQANKSEREKDLETKLAIVLAENEKLNRIIEEVYEVYMSTRNHHVITEEYEHRIAEIYADLDQWKKKYNALESQNNIVELQNNLKNLKSQNDMLNEQLNRKDRDLEALRARLASLGNAHTEFDTKIRALLAENDKLNHLLADKVEEVRQLKEMLSHAHSKHEEVSITLNRQAEEHHKSSAVNQREVQNRMQALIQENEELHGQVHNLEDQLHRALAEKKELEERAVRITVEVDRLQGIIRDLRHEIEDWKQKAAYLESHKSTSDRELVEISKQFEGVKAMNLQNKEFQMKFSAERTAYETQIMQMNQIINDLERKVQMLTVENERVNTLCVQRLTMIEDLRKNNNEEKYKLELYGLKNQMEIVKSHSYDIEQAAAHYANQKSVDQSKINELTQLNASCRAELDNLKGLLEKRRVEVESLAGQNEDLRRMCEQMNQGRFSSSSTSVKAETVELMQNKIAELERSRNEYQRQADRNAVELARKNKELVDKIHEMDVLKLRYEEAVANYQALNAQLFSRISVKHY